MPTLRCGACAQLITVSRDAPEAILCPHCRTRVSNPYAGAAVEPIPAIPVDEQASWDTKGASFALIVMIVSLFVGAVAMTMGLSGLAFLPIIAFAGGLIWFAARFSPPNIASEVNVPEPPPAANEPGQVPVLDYRPPRRYRQEEEPASTGAVVGGFFMALGVCAAGFIALGVTVNMGAMSSIALATVAAAVIGAGVLGANVGARPGWRGFGRGTAIGMVLGMMALGPCGFCYIMFLSN